MKLRKQKKILKKALKLVEESRLQSEGNVGIKRKFVKKSNTRINIHKPVTTKTFTDREWNCYLQSRKECPEVTFVPMPINLNPRPSKKTIYRLYGRLLNFKSERRKQNLLNAKHEARTPYVWKRANTLRPIVPHVNEISLVVSTTIFNYIKLKRYNIVPKATKVKENKLRLLPKNQRLDDGLNCKERRKQYRFILHYGKKVA